jgi:hypothetical protein
MTQIYFPGKLVFANGNIPAAVDTEEDAIAIYKAAW